MENMEQRKQELERRHRARERRKQWELKKKRKRKILFGGLACILALAVGALLGVLSLSAGKRIRREVDLSALRAPEWITQDFFAVNPYSRPGTDMYRVNGVVIHYVANPGTSARQNWNYFNNLKDQKGENATSASSHFIIGLEGEILQGIPMDEIAYSTSKEKNVDTVSIECCHPDATGEFNEDTYASLVKLTAWVCDSVDLTEKDVIRHYDATGKNCPKYYVENEKAWKDFKKDVKAELKKLKQEREEQSTAN